MIAALVAALVLLKPYVLYVPEEMAFDVDADAFTAELLDAASRPVGVHPSCFCGP